MEKEDPYRAGVIVGSGVGSLKCVDVYKRQAYSRHWYKHQYCCIVDYILQILFSSYLISLSFNQLFATKIRSISISSPDVYKRQGAQAAGVKSLIALLLVSIGIYVVNKKEGDSV